MGFKGMTMILRQTCMKRQWLALCAILAASGRAFAAAPAEDVARANELYQRGNCEGALPIYERLAATEPNNVLFADRLGFCLYGMMDIQPAGKAREELIVRAQKEIERALALGDKDLVLPQMLANLKSDEVHQLNPERESLRQAEAAFGRGDIDAALAGYKAVAAINPRSYIAHVYAGDMYYRKGDVTAAGEWFSKAIAINPNVETAYRYWGDSLTKAGDNKAALTNFIGAVVAEPYNQYTIAALGNWAKRNGATLQAPQVPRPVVNLKDDGSGKGPQPGINLDQNLLSDVRSGAAWMAYALNRIVWMKEKYLQRNPGATAYRHSLDEEVESLRKAVDALHQEDLPAAAQLPALRDLLRISQDGMLEAYVLLNGVDAGIAQDYPAWRDAHREQIAAFIDKYIVVRGGTGK
jgi:tetratricopeptide (TPR) repeat protein